MANKDKTTIEEQTMHKSIKLIGIKTHGIKNISVEIPHDKITIITGLSGSGKSSLAIDTLFAEGQRRYLESLSSYARQFLNKFEKPDFEKITGLRPAIAIEQKTQGYNPRSTTGTVTEIYDYLRVLYARIGTAYSPTTGKALIANNPSEITSSIYKLNSDKITILASIAKNKKGSFRFELSKIQKAGFSEAIIDNETYDLDFMPDLDRNKFHNIEIVVAKYSLSHTEKHEVEAACAQALKYGNGFMMVQTENATEYYSSSATCPISGFALPEMSPRLFSFNSPVGACKACVGLGQTYQETEDDNYETTLCKSCNGKRLNQEALCVKINNLTIMDFCALSLDEAKKWIDKIKLDKSEKEIAKPIILEISKRLGFLLNVGLDYLTLDRAAQTLSGGESQRIRLASQIGSSLEGVLYVLDEPSIGLHPKDNQKLIDTLKNLRDLGNTIVVVEHDEETMLQSDHIIEMGPKAGVHGGEVTFAGPVEKLLKANTITSEYLNKTKKISCEKKEINFETCNKIKIENASLNNLQNLNIEIPLNHLIGVCGVSGSGKSTLIMEVLTDAIKKHLNKQEPRFCKISGHIINFEIIDQSSIGRTPRSTPATYTNIMTPLREWFAKLPESQARGYTASRFSFNVAQGRCRLCNGEGIRHIEMHFMPNIEIQCESCLGKRYNKETLEIKFNDLSIADVLELTVEDALEVFNFVPAIKKMLQTLKDVHLHYLKLGQSATTLSGGEAQRMKLAKILGIRKQHEMLYILDEPTTGLHFDDVQALLQVLKKLVNQGNTVLMIEHHVDMLRMCDWLIEIGPEGGKKGGKLIAQGTFETLKEQKTPTGNFL